MERSMNRRPPTRLLLIAALQFIPPLVLPPDLLASMSPAVWGVVAVLFLTLGINLVRHRAWARLATVFVQGFSIIVRLLVLVGHVRVGGDPTAAVDGWLLGATVVSMALSGLILYTIDTPEVQMAMQ
jgi:hypothetical protein